MILRSTLAPHTWRLFTSVSLTVFSLALFACDTVDNQKTILMTQLNVANPTPTVSNTEAARNNAKHKILLGVLDTGVDYNNPLLQKNIHFDFDMAGSPSGLGYDYTADDRWPAPYLIRTSVYDPSIGGYANAAASRNRDAIAKIAESFPMLRPFLQEDRNIYQEFYANAAHGTHVAGLMVYDRPDFGLRAYRVTPLSIHPDPKHDYQPDAINNIIAAIDRAAADGVRIINLSLGVDFQQPSGNSAQAQAEYASFMNTSERLSAAIKKHSNILFVTAAGNSESWIDGRSRMGMPCGVKAPNVLCVGALKENGDMAAYTNLVVSGVDLVFTLGHKVLSTIPTDMCVSQGLSQLQGLDQEIGSEKLFSIGLSLQEACLQTPGLAIMSGSSMATPITTHVAAEILSDNPALTPSEIIESIYNRSYASFVGNYAVFKLPIKKPSWYLNESSGLMTLSKGAKLGAKSLADQIMRGVSKNLFESNELNNAWNLVVPAKE